MDPLSRILLEHSFEAILDAGINPRTLKGQKIGVFIGTNISETDKNWFICKQKVNV
jgi:fatty acid synthase